VAVPEIDNRVDEDWKIRHGRVRRVHAVDERGNVFGPLQTDSKVVMSVSALSAYFLFAAIAFWLDRKRSGRMQ
jgi:hypothetical protein